MTFLTRTDAARNIDRFYFVQVTPTLFGEWAVLREWGGRGSAGTVRLSSYGRQDEAEEAEQRTIKRRLQHGYRARNAPQPGHLRRDEAKFGRDDPKIGGDEPKTALNRAV